ncbi:MAG: carbohydrate binding family 9 domain-containing protein, partial [Bacteroidales bacterium]|nr:carbohydrate binding family 9 domain-containing protein [Bacteroidales bacterium]
ISTPPVINGHLDDEAWSAGEWGGDFFQFEPAEGAPVRQKTEFKILYDDSDIYVAIKAYDTAPDSIVSRMTRRDDTDGDVVMIALDSYFDQRTAFGFGVSAAGVKGDLIWTDDGMNEDETFDPIWYVRTAIYDWGWAAEMRIPLTQLRFSASENQTWGLEIIREIYRHDETDLWQPIARNASGLVHNAGLLNGLNNIKPRTLFDLTPYGVAKLETYEAEEGNPWLDGSDFKVNAGLDAKIGITNNMIMSLTLNPDFGQVEADPSEVNLTAFESYFREKRPFFIEGKNITSFGLGIGDGDVGNDNLFYSRRIGRSPRHPASPDESEYAYTPAFIPIIGAAKLTGKSGSGLSVGAIDAVTAEVNTKIYNEETGETSYVKAEPFANYAVGRVQQDFKGGKTIIGGMMTSTIRSLDEETEDYFHKSATAAGLDFTQYFRDMNYIFQVRTAFSNITGNENDIARTQRSPVHNYVRPDADYVEYDPTRTSLSGYGGNLLTGKIGGNLNLLYLASWKSPGFELNDLGYMRVADQFLGVGVINYSINKPFSIFNRMSFGTNVFHVADFGGNTLMVGDEFSWHAGYKNLWNTYFGGGVNSRERDNLLLRGGPSMLMPGTARFSGGVSTSERKKLVAELDLRYGWGFEDYYEEYELGVELSYRPFNTLTLSAEPEWSKSRNIMQYVETTENDGDSDDPRYIFGSIDQEILSISFRIDYSITPDLTIQYWGQPFFGSGSYTDFKYITDPNAAAFTDRFHTYNDNEIIFDEENGSYLVDEDIDGSFDYSFGKPDFTVSEFLSNLVVRWEFLPGSTAYLVWSQTRDYYTGDGYFDMSDQVHELLTARRPYNVFLIKLSYRFGLR